MTVVTTAIGGHDPVVVFGVLVIVFRHDRVSRGRRLTGQGLILVDDLLRVSANLDVGPIAVEILRSRRTTAAAPPTTASPAHRTPSIRT